MGSENHDLRKLIAKYQTKTMRVTKERVGKTVVDNNWIESTRKYF